MSERERFDAWLEDELPRLLNPVTERPAPAARYGAPAGGRTWRPFRLASGAGAAFGAKAATGLVVAAFAAGATATAITGSANPADWSTTVQQVVDTCRAGTSDGIGGCVAAVATQHGEGVASGAREEHPSPSATGAHGPTVERSGDPEASPEASEHPRTPAPHGTAHPSPTPSKGRGDHDPRPTPTASDLHRPDPTHSPTPSDSD